MENRNPRESRIIYSVSIFRVCEKYVKVQEPQRKAYRSVYAQVITYTARMAIQLSFLLLLWPFGTNINLATLDFDVPYTKVWRTLGDQATWLFPPPRRYCSAITRQHPGFGSQQRQTQNFSEINVFPTNRAVRIMTSHLITYMPAKIHLMKTYLHSQI